MRQGTVKYTADNGLCCGCGVCKGICPKKCISWERKNGLYVPRIDEIQCINCGMCLSVCPGFVHKYEPGGSAEEAVTGSVLLCCNAWSKDALMRHVCASGGVVMTMIQELLTAGFYDGAFCLDSYDYKDLLKTRLYTPEEVKDRLYQSGAPKSRYLPVSHESALEYMKNHRETRLIIVGTSCAIRGLQSAVKILNLKREQYLFVGLFCDQVFNYNVVSFFQDTHADGKTIRQLHFKNKESGGWPGDMKAFPEVGDPFYISKAERMKAKPWFVPERCLYCVDKLNVCADISLGDNYTGKDSSSLGSNSVIIRTEPGMEAWRAVSHRLEAREVEIQDIQKAQYLQGRLNNLRYADLKRLQLSDGTKLNDGIPEQADSREFIVSLKSKRKQLEAGGAYDRNPVDLRILMWSNSAKGNPAIRFVRSAVRRFIDHICRKMEA